ncbi:hypothetical protein C7M61_002579 [Candidozyma pseudohaemuli]|uniref:Chromatin structure-remodeling complex subunit RSC7 n=1 Tax=Candidozyma pseudohaemuli TaxID=418784 RepID=A0A2P7YRR5_9ASCO|nr:hypothetical protein C7M61_002579 [[Candida] pseudohaemulonii]PSK38644.1 hypothetical protein C7M61_002579 [[Candida] pseudohaemulonii]
MSAPPLDDENGTARSPRQLRKERVNLAGLDLMPEADDEEYKEGDENGEYDESGVKDDDEDADINDDDDIDVDDEDDEVVKPGRPRGRKRKSASDELDNEDGEKEVKAEEEGEKKPEETPAEGEPPKKKGKKRGRKPKIPRPDDIIYDDKGNEINVQNDEIVLDEEDPKGCEKVDALGRLQGDRKYRVKTFTLLGKGERLYMVSTEPARLVGFRDSYLLFKTHLSLFKKVCTHEEKMDLIDRHLIPTSYKGRSVNLVTARSIYREFGARMVVGGKKVIDDFWEQQAIDRGDVSGEYADPEEANTSNRAASYGAENYQNQITGSALINYQADPTWMYQVCKQTLDFNSTLTEQRNQVWLRGIKDPYSGFNFYPEGSQPKRAVYKKLSSNGDFKSSLAFYNPDIRRKVTGLASIPKEIFDDIEDEEIKKAILEQQAYERAAARL